MRYPLGNLEVILPWRWNLLLSRARISWRSRFMSETHAFSLNKISRHFWGNLSPSQKVFDSSSFQDIVLQLASSSCTEGLIHFQSSLMSPSNILTSILEVQSDISRWSNIDSSLALHSITATLSFNVAILLGYCVASLQHHRSIMLQSLAARDMLFHIGPFSLQTLCEP